MQAPEGSADECLDPALMSAFEDGTAYQWHADAGPPSPFDLSTIDPDLLALYPEHERSVNAPKSSSPTTDAILPPPANDGAIPCSSNIDGASDEQDASAQSPPKKRVRFASTPPCAQPTSAAAGTGRRVRVTRAQPETRKRDSAPASRKYTALGTAKRTMSDGTLVPPFACARAASGRRRSASSSTTARRAIPAGAKEGSASLLMDASSLTVRSRRTCARGSRAARRPAHRCASLVK